MASNRRAPCSRPSKAPGLRAQVPAIPPSFLPNARRAITSILVDPLGSLMLRFPRDPDPSKMVKDLERLLKYPGFG